LRREAMTYLVLFTPACHFHTLSIYLHYFPSVTKPGKTARTTKVMKGEEEAKKKESYAVMCEGKPAS
jgi:hypothetical protein